MLKYFKKQKGRRRGSNTLTTADELDDGRCSEADLTISAERAKRNSLRSSSSFCDDLLSQAEEGGDDVDGAGTGTGTGSCGGSVSLCGTSFAADDDIFKYHSRLAMSLPSIVSEPNCLSYFVQYLETRNALSLLKFYLDTENFKVAAITQLEKQQASQVRLEKHPEESEQEEKQQRPLHVNELPQSNPESTDSLRCANVAANHVNVAEAEQNSVPELKTLYDLSMRKPLTDDEKSQIYAETNKKMHKCNGNLSLNKLKSDSDLSLCSSASANNADGECGHTAVGCISAASVNDAIAIYQKYLIVNAMQFVSLPVTLLSEISLVLCQRTDEQTSEASAGARTKLIAPTCFDDAQRHVLEQLEREYLNDFLQSTFYCKYCIELIESGEDRLSIFDILYSEVTLFFFMEYLEQHGERECLDFWTAAINFRKSYTTADTMLPPDAAAKCVESEAQTDAMIIYEKFFSLQSENRFWVSDKLRSRVEERICATGHVAYCFDLPLQVVAKYLERKYFADFLSSQLFVNYLSELKMKVNEEAVVGQLPTCNALGAAATHNSNTLRRTGKSVCATARHRKTLSDCSNESSRDAFKHISQHNTLLAMDATKLPAHLKNLHNTGTNMNIDSRQLTNPNLLWHRSSSTEGGLKFGHVNALGRYERDFDTIDSTTGGGHLGGKHNWSLNFGGNKIKNAMRKLVNLPEEKMQEEIAWQVAEMIVKDVTSITLNKDRSVTNVANVANANSKECYNLKQNGVKP